MRLITDLPTQQLVDQIKANEDLWLQITDRQKYPGSAHSDSESIFLRWCEGQNLLAAFTEIPAYDYPAFAMLPAARPLIAEVLKRTAASQLGRALIVKLKPGGKVTPHIDEGAYADHYERFHVILESGDGNVFFCGDEQVQMRPGELWYFDHKTEHSVINDSDKPRVHLVVDAVSPTFRKERRAIQ